MGPQIRQAFLAPLRLEISREPSVSLEPSLMSYLNERSVVTEVTEVSHVSSLGLEREFNTSMPATPKTSELPLTVTNRSNKTAWETATWWFS